MTDEVPMITPSHEDWHCEERKKSLGSPDLPSDQSQTVIAAAQNRCLDGNRQVFGDIEWAKQQQAEAEVQHRPASCTSNHPYCEHHGRPSHCNHRQRVEEAMRE